MVWPPCPPHPKSEVKAMLALHSKPNRLTAGICLMLALGTLILYWPVAHHPFITLDDNLYVTACPQVQSGLTWAGGQWAFTNTFASNWHPLTWLAHMLNCQLFGQNAGAHHLVNVFFHIVNTLLVFFWLKNLTNALWRSALVATLFAWHPLHVESVAWVAELKDVLSAFFWMLTLMIYTRYARSVRGDGQQATNNSASTTIYHSSLFYMLALFFFACSLMSKPMAVTLPFVLLLIDFWPLQRIQNVKMLMLEKIPFLTLAFVTSWVNFIAQKGGGATWSTDAMPLASRVANALIAYARYVCQSFWPTDLAIIYPYQHHWPLPALLASALFFVFISGLAIWRLRQMPFLFFGWFYFVGTLVPTIGLVQVGPQAMADRYMYLPSLGLFVLVVWGVNELLSTRMHLQKMVVPVTVLVIVACWLCTAHQLKFWASSVKLFARTVAVTPDNYTAADYLGGALDLAGQHDDALLFYAESVRINPHFPMSQWNLGVALLRQGRAAEAAEHLAVAAMLTPADPIIRNYYGKALFLAGNPSQAEAQLAEALRLNPDLADAQLNLAVVLATQNKTAAALPHFAAAVRREPANAEMHFNYGLALLDEHQPDQAAAQFTEELRLTPDEPKAHYRLALALQAQGQTAEAVTHLQQALKLSPNFSEARTALDALLTAHPELK
jgi:tetratricopeptide (TPR) repeat protein